MTTHAEPCCKPHRVPTKQLGAVAVGQALVLFMLPKCPLCVAAQLSLFGLSAGLSYALAPLVWPLGLGGSAVVLALLYWLYRR
jgi:hypothetical protein